MLRKTLIYIGNTNIVLMYMSSGVSHIHKDYHVGIPLTYKSNTDIVIVIYISVIPLCYSRIYMKSAMNVIRTYISNYKLVSLLYT